MYFIDLVIIGLSVGMVYALVALGISLIFSGLDIIHFAHGEIYMLGAFIGLMLFQKTGPHYILNAAARRDHHRPLRRHHRARVLSPAHQRGGGYTVAGMGMVIVGFGMSIVLQNLAFLIWGAKAIAAPGTDFGRPIELGNLTLPMSYVWIMVRRSC